MSAEYTNGGPAFPCDGIVRRDERGNHRGAPVSGSGLSRRQYYAAKALAGMLAHPTRYHPRPGAPTNWHEAIAQEAFEIADAMLAMEQVKP